MTPLGSQFRVWLRRFPALLGALAAVAAVAPLSAEDTPPVLLREVLLTPPLEVAGTDLAPEVKVRVLVDARGRVAEVEVLSIDPASEYDEAIRRKATDALMRWRYAPARRDGKPVEARLDWSVKFSVGQEGFHSARSSTRTLVPWFVAVNQDVEARRARVMSLPREKRREILLSLAKTAEANLIQQRRHEFATPRFLVVTDVEDPDLARIIASNLEATLNFVDQVMQPHIEPQPSDLKILVYLFAQEASYKSARRELSSRSLGSAAYFTPGLILFHAQTHDLMGLLIHEACHGYSDHALRRPGSRLPRWLEEGFAEYMGNSQIKKGKLLPGRTIKRQYVISHYGVAKQATSAAWDLERIKDTLRAGEILTLEEMVSADADLFYGDRSSVYYGMSWLFVHFLRHGESDWAEDRFPKLMLYLAEGYPAKEALEVAYGRGLGAFERPFLDYVAKF